MVIESTYRTHLLFGTLLGIHLLYTLTSIGLFPVDLDEPFTIFHSSQSLSDIVALMKEENNPPLYFMLIHFWEKIVGIEQVPIRLFSLLISCGTLSVIWYGTRSFLNYTHRFILGILFITSNFHHWGSMETRAYGLFNLMVIALFLFWIKLVTQGNQHTKRNFIYLGILNVLMFYTHYIHVTLIAAQFILMLIYVKQYPIKNWIVAALTFSIGTLPLMSVFFERGRSIGSGGNWINQAHWTELYGLFIRFCNGHLAALTGCLILVLLVFSIVKKSMHVQPQQVQILSITLVFCVLPYLLLFGLSTFGFVHLFYDKYLYFILIPCCFTVLFFIEWVKPSVILTALFISFFVAGSKHIPDTNRNGNELAAFVKQQHPEFTLISPHFYGLTFAYNYDKQLYHDKGLLVNYWKHGIFPFSEISQLPPLLATKIVYVNAHASDSLCQQSKELLKKHGFHLCAKKKFKGPYWVYVYLRKN